MLVNNDPAVAAQGMELLVAQEPTAEELRELIMPMLRASHTARNIAAMRVIHRFSADGGAEEGTACLRGVAIRLIYSKLKGVNWRTVERGISLLVALDCPVTTWEMLKRVMSSVSPGVASYFRARILARLDVLVDKGKVLGCEYVLYSYLFGNYPGYSFPPLLERMPRLCEIDFSYCRNVMPSWLHRLPSLKTLDLRQAVHGTLTNAELPPALTSLSLQGSPVESVRLSMKSLVSLDLSRCGQLVELDLTGCDALESLSLSGVRCLPQLPDISKLPALTRLDISQCHQFELSWSEAWMRPGLQIICDHLMHKDQQHPLRMPTPEDTPSERAAALASIKFRLSSARPGTHRVGLSAMEALSEEDRAAVWEMSARSVRAHLLASA